MQASVRTKKATSVLVIDDDELIRELLATYLDSNGFVVRLAEDGQSGLDSFKATPTDVVLLDVMMPGINGFETCEAIRKTKQGKFVPIIMITADDSPGATEKAFVSGATDFASKPLNLDLLLHRIQFVLRAQDTADALRRREYSLERAQKLAGLGNWRFDIKSDDIESCKNMQQMLQLDSTEMDKQSFLDRIDAEDRHRVAQYFLDLKVLQDVRPVEFSWPMPGGVTRQLTMSADITGPADRREQTIVGVIQDNTERRRTESQIHTLAYFDTVTGLANRLLSNQYLARAVETARANETAMAVLFVDLDHFKKINDTWGHSTGDEVLRIAADRLKGCLRSDDMAGGRQLEDGSSEIEGRVARVGGDEFVIVASNLLSIDEAALIARRINKVMCAAIHVNGNEVFIGSSVGISVFPDDGTDAEKLLKQADAAMYEAKRSGRNCYRFFTKDIQNRAFQQLELENRLRKAIHDEQFVLEFQPKIDIATQQLNGVEALVRWNDPVHGLMYPDEFVGLAEESGLIVPLGQWILREACKQARIINGVLKSRVGMAVNLSALQVGHGSIVATVESALNDSELDPQILELELTESNILKDARRQIELLHQLKSLGVKLSIDDFGTGYSSLRYLKEFPIDALKIDRSFIQGVIDSQEDAAIVKSVINLAHNLQLDVVAEGIETQDQMDFLTVNGCDQAQGYLLCRPMALSQLIMWVRNRNGGDNQPVASADNLIDA